MVVRYHRFARFAFACLFFLTTMPAFAQEIGVQLYTFRNQLPKDIPGTLEKISQMGIRELEAGGSYGLPVDEFKSLLKKNNFKITFQQSGEI